MGRFEFSTAGRIIFGEGVIKEAASIVSLMGKRLLVVSGIRSEFGNPLMEALRSSGIECCILEVVSEPTIESIQSGLRVAEETACDTILSIGGGSAIDTGKMIAVLATNAGNILDYLEVIGKGKQIQTPGLPMIAVPTTAGTGAEVTRNAVIGSPELGLKVSLRSPWMLPKVALIDPELTYSLPPEVTAATGLDALTQLIEPFVSVSANPLTDAVCRDGIRWAAGCLRRAYNDGRDFEARRGMALASLFGGMALANARLGAVHGFAGVIGGKFPIPHGMICACLLPIVTEVNLRALRRRQPEASAKQHYDEVGQLVTGRSGARAEEGVQWLEELTRELNVPSLSRYGVTREAIPDLVEMAKQSSSMKGNPIILTDDELVEILERALLTTPQ